MSFATFAPTVPWLAVPVLQWTPCGPDQPGENLDYTLNVSPTWMQQGEQLAIVSVIIAPSGSGELICSDLSANGSVITADFTGGVAGRAYVSPILMTWPPFDPPSWGFGTATTWASGATVFGPAIAAVNEGLILTGTNLATALPLLAAFNQVASSPVGTSGVLPVGIISGTITVENNDPSNNAMIRPPSGAAISVGGISLGINVPYNVSPSQRVGFTTNSPSTLWIAA
jgi:hypothetical protein